MAGGDTVARIKEKLTIADVVGPHVKLVRAGKYMKGLCPFHKEKTPSFHVSPERGTWHCFGCGEGGDMFSFVEKTEGVDFKGALKILAERAGVPLEYTQANPERKEKIDRAREAMARAEQYFARMLTDDSATYRYAVSRKLSPDTIRGWNLGYAPDTWRALLEELSAAGFTAQELLEAGLVKEAEGKPGTYYDRFRNRLMFPIRDIVGRTVAFTGRTLDATEQAKYLNSPETELFRKSSILFALDRAKDAIRIRGYALLMEGQMDVLHAHQAGFENAIGLSGTALTDEHLALLLRYSENLMLALDGDRAGIAATWKHALSALKAGLRVKAVRLPEGKDPADLISEDPQDFAERVAHAETIVEFFLAHLSETEKDPHRLVIAVERIVLPLIAAQKSPIEREHFVGIVARAIASTPEAVRDSLKKVINTPVSTNASAGTPSVKTKFAERIPDEVLLAAIAESYPGTVLANRVKSEYARIVGRALTEEGSPEHVLFETGILYGEAPAEHAADDVLNRLERATLEEAYAAALRALRAAQSRHDSAALGEAEIACAELAKDIAKL